MDQLARQDRRQTVSFLQVGDTRYVHSLPGDGFAQGNGCGLEPRAGCILGRLFGDIEACQDRRQGPRQCLHSR